jgi:hypothetical protein
VCSPRRSLAEAGQLASQSTGDGCLRSVRRSTS